MRLQNKLFQTERQTSFLNGRDYQALDRLLALHSPADNPFILDTTHNQGTMWEGCQYKPDIRLDITPLRSVDTVGDFASLPFPDSTFDVIVFDPPHLPASAASTYTTLSWKKRYGITDTGKGREGHHIADMFPPFLSEARRLLRPDGVVLAKIADLVHNHAYQWQQVSFVNACLAAGLTPCDMLIKVQSGASHLNSGKWEIQNHLRKDHCYWIVARNGKSEKRAGGYKIERRAVVTQAEQPVLW